MKLSIVATLYQSAPYLEEFCRRAATVGFELAGQEYEIVLVNDGSPDESLGLALSQQQLVPQIRIVDLSRNFGHHRAMMTGLREAQGDLVFLIDSDLEEEPEWLPVFASELNEKNCDVVYGVQNSRKGGGFERTSGDLFYKLFRLLTGEDLPANQTTARLMTRRYVDALIQHDEREVFMAGLLHITGFEQHPMEVEKHSKGKSTYTLGRKLELFINSVTSFSNAPLIGIFYTGIGLSLLSIVYIAYLVLNWLFFGSPPSGWTSVMASIWLIGGMVISFIGVIGIYLSKVFFETKRRPYSIIRKIYSDNSDKS